MRGAHDDALDLDRAAPAIATVARLLGWGWRVTDEPADDGAEHERRRDRLTRWRLVLGGEEADGIGEAACLDGDDAQARRALRDLYDGERRGGLGASAPGSPGGWATSAATSRPRSCR